MTTNTDQIKKTVADLLRLAENNAATEGEVENAIRFARRLMDAHHLSEEECRKDPHAFAAKKEIMGEQATYGFVRTLSVFVEKLVGSVGIYRTRKQIVKKNNIVQFDANGDPDVRCGLVYFGPQEDIALACELFDSLHQTIATLARLKYGGTMRGPGRNYCEGFVVGLNQKLNEAKEKDLISSESRSLIVQSTAIAKATRERAVRWFEEQNGKLKKGGEKKKGTFNSDAYKNGIADGNNLNPTVNRRAKVEGSQQRLS